MTESKQIFRSSSILGIILVFFTIWISLDPDQTFTDKYANDIFNEQIKLGNNDLSGFN